MKYKHSETAVSDGKICLYIVYFRIAIYKQTWIVAMLSHQEFTMNGNNFTAAQHIQHNHIIKTYIWSLTLMLVSILHTI